MKKNKNLKRQDGSVYDVNIKENTNSKNNTNMVVNSIFNSLCNFVSNYFGYRKEEEKTRVQGYNRMSINDAAKLEADHDRYRHEERMSGIKYGTVCIGLLAGAYCYCNKK